MGSGENASLGISFIGIVEKQATEWNKREVGIGTPKTEEYMQAKAFQKLYLKS